MKNIIYGLSLSVLVFLIACSDSSVNVKSENQSSKKAFDRTVGAVIDREVGLKWITRFTTMKISAKDEASYFFVTQSNLQKLLGSSNNVEGLTFHHAIDDSGNYHIIVIPVDSGLRIWTSSLSNRIFIDANSNSIIDLEDARKWIERYQQENPLNAFSKYFHFWGTDIFLEIIKSKDFEVKRAVDDDGKSTMVLLTYPGDNNARARSLSSAVTIYDMNRGCPPCAAYY
jgi:hypothetical protein